jgi:hypothetical protein
MNKQSNRLGMYVDVQEVLDAALAAGGGRYDCLDHGMAVHWRQRAYKFRKAYAASLPANARSAYDAIVMPRIAPADTFVTIAVRRAEGTFTPIEDGVPFLPDLDELDAAAKELAEKIERGEII